MIKIKCLVLAVGIAMTFGIAGCSNASSADSTALSTDNAQSEQNISETVSIIGSTTVQPLAESVTVLFNEKYPDILVAGNSAIIPSSLTDPARTLTANIALEMGHASGLHQEALFATAVILFIFIMVLNFIFNRITNKVGAKY